VRRWAKAAWGRAPCHGGGATASCIGLTARARCSSIKECAIWWAEPPYQAQGWRRPVGRRRRLRARAGAREHANAPPWPRRRRGAPLLYALLDAGTGRGLLNQGGGGGGMTRHNTTHAPCKGKKTIKKNSALPTLPALLARLSPALAALSFLLNTPPLAFAHPTPTPSTSRRHGRRDSGPGPHCLRPSGHRGSGADVQVPGGPARDRRGRPGGGVRGW
jgi:hypothetical protein